MTDDQKDPKSSRKKGLGGEPEPGLSIEPPDFDEEIVFDWAGEEEPDTFDGAHSPDEEAEAQLATGSDSPYGDKTKPGGLGLEELVAGIDAEMELLAGGNTGRPEQVKDSNLGTRHLVFFLAGVRFAIALDRVVEVGRHPIVTPVPQVPNWLNGVTNLRGEVLSVIDLAVFLESGDPISNESGRMIVLRDAQEERTTCVIVNQILGIRPIHEVRIGRTAAPIEDKVARYLRGVYQQDQQMVLILDTDRFLSSDEFRLFEQ